MKLTMDGIKNREAWEKAGIQLPGYNVKEVSEKAKKEPAPAWNAGGKPPSGPPAPRGAAAMPARRVQDK